MLSCLKLEPPPNNHVIPVGVSMVDRHRIDSNQVDRVQEIPNDNSW